MPCCMNGNKNFGHACMAWQALCTLMSLCPAVLSFLHSTLFTTPQHRCTGQHSSLSSLLLFTRYPAIPYDTSSKTTLPDDSSNCHKCSPRTLLLVYISVQEWTTLFAFSRTHPTLTTCWHPFVLSLIPWKVSVDEVGLLSFWYLTIASTCVITYQ